MVIGSCGRIGGGFLLFFGDKFIGEVKFRLGFRDRYLGEGYFR